MSAQGGHGGLASQRVREKMVERLREQGIRDSRVLGAMAEVPRHAFVDPALASRAYEDSALPIGHGQTISQPYVVARTIELAIAGVSRPAVMKVLEIGTGCGYAAAVLSRIVRDVYSIERVRALHQLARGNLRALRIPNLHLVHADGLLGLPDQAPFDAVVAAAAGSDIAVAWLEQVAPGGVVVAPIGATVQQLTVFRRDAGGRIARKAEGEVRFVPLRSGVQ